MSKAKKVEVKNTSLTTKAKENNLEVTEPTNSQLIPAYIKKGNRGLENVKKEDLLLPRIKLLQSNSPEVTEKKGEVGDMINSLSAENYGKEMMFIPLIQGNSRAYWESKERDADILCSSDDGILPSTRVEEPISKACSGCPASQFTKGKNGKEEPPKCAEFYNFPILVNGKDPAVLSFFRSKIIVAKKILSMAMLSGKGLDLFSLRMKLRTKVERSPKGEYYNFDVVGSGFVSEEEYKLAESFYTTLKNKYVIHQEGIATEAVQ